MKILNVTPLPPYYRGGIERVVSEITERQSRHRDVDVNVWSGTLGHAQTCDWNGVHVRTYKTSKRAGYASSQMFGDLKRRARDFDVVHAHGSSSLIPIMAALAVSKTPLVVSPYFHSQASGKLLGILKPPFERVVNPYILRKAKTVVCVSETEADAIRQRFSVSNKIVVIYPGVNAEEIQAAEPYEFDGTLILYVGRLERYKNVQRIVEAAKYLPEDFSFYIVGEGPYKGELATVVERKRLEGRVRLLGICTDTDLYRWIKTSALLVNLSEVESFGITVLEALAAGKPVLVNGKSGLRELASRFGWAISLISPERLDSRELAKAIDRAARIEVGSVDLDDFRWDNIADRTLALYERALGM
ncbi:MAG TPA: glycosyltransferase family 4 protein [Candidatus Acidoferrales bacterium]|nr:glycosyltransferase family 4 protein [Candidatus Acidoferrales bacterium]